MSYGPELQPIVTPPPPAKREAGYTGVGFPVSGVMETGSGDGSGSLCMIRTVHHTCYPEVAEGRNGRS